MEGSVENRRPRGRVSTDPHVEALIAELATRQHGVISLQQLTAFGLSASAVRSRVGIDRLHRVHEGVYAVGHARLTGGGRFMAAVLACGDGAALSHRSGAAHQGLRPDNRRTTDVTSPKRRGRTSDNITAHSGATLLARDVETIDAIPTTTVARTLLDLADVIDRRGLERAVDRAETLRALDMNAIDDVLTRADGRRGATTLRTLLSEMQLGATITRNDLEEAFLHICRHANTAPDATNAWIPYPDGGGGAEADFLWHAHKLIIEVDGRATHTTAHAFEHDRRRDQRLSLLGWRVIRFSRRQVLYEADDVAATVAALLA